MAKYIYGFIGILVLLCVAVLLIDKNKKVITLASLVPVPSVNADNSDFIKNYMPQISANCPGLVRHKDDWQFDQISSTGFTILVKNETQNKALWDYGVTGNRCFFDLSKDSSRVFIPKRACASLCKDTRLEDGEFEIPVVRINGKYDSNVLTELERQEVSSSLGAMMVWLDKEEYQYNVIMEKITESTNKDETDRFLLDEYLKAKLAIEEKALTGDYQFQRNTAYMYANDSKKMGGDAKLGCAWYLIVLASDSPKANTGSDKSNVETYCSSKRLNDFERQEAFALARDKSLLIYNSTESFDKTYGIN